MGFFSWISHANALCLTYPWVSASGAALRAGPAQDPSSTQGSLWGNLGADFTGLGFSSASVPRELKRAPFKEERIQEFCFFFLIVKEKKKDYKATHNPTDRPNSNVFFFTPLPPRNVFCFKCHLSCVHTFALL